MSDSDDFTQLDDPQFLAEPESLGDDMLESCLYILREKLRAAS
jgi:hypothetical protein